MTLNNDFFFYVIELFSFPGPTEENGAGAGSRNTQFMKFTISKFLCDIVKL